MPDSMIVVQTRMSAPPLDEVGDDFFKAFFAHFTMGNCNPCSWQELPQLGCLFLDAAGVIEQVENLALA